MNIPRTNDHNIYVGNESEINVIGTKLHCSNNT